MFTQFFENLMNGLLLVVRVGPFVLPLVAACLCILPAKDRGELLAQDYDGKRMFLFGLGVALASAFAPNGMVGVGGATFGATLMALGGLVWLPDFLTNGRLQGVMTAILCAGLSAVMYVIGIGYNSFGLVGIPNLYGLGQLMQPVGIAIVFGSLAVFAMLTDNFKNRILPKNGDGLRLVGVGVAVLIIAVFNVNPVAMVALTAAAATIITLGALIAAWDIVTNILLYPWFAVAYIVIAGYALLFSK